MQAVMSEVANVKHWKTLAHYLSLSDQHISDIKETCGADPICEVIKIWVELLCPTWKVLANALDSSGEHEIAANIRRKYIDHQPQTPGN